MRLFYRLLFFWLGFMGLVACGEVDTITPTAVTLPAMVTSAPTLPPTATTAATPLAPTIPPDVTSPATLTPIATTAPTEPPPVVAIPTVEGALLDPGFQMQKFADLYRPTSLAFDSNGRLYATSVDGTIHVFVDNNGDGTADINSVLSSGFNVPLGITIQPGTGDIYVSSNSKISIVRDFDGDLVADEAVNFAHDLPYGRHQNDNLKFGPDGLLYISIGSTCDACAEANPMSASIVRYDTTNGQSEIYATGLRNPYDLAFEPQTGALFATDNGRDDLGLDAPGEELNLIVQGGNYGWPTCWDEAQGTDCAGMLTAVAFFEPHSSANSLDFYSGSQFPAAYQNNAFVGITGSWLKDDVQTGIRRVVLHKVGDSYQSEVYWFARWPGRPLGLIQGPDGALYVGDYDQNAIYRISYVH